MGNVGPDKRSFERIELDDLRRLATLAYNDLSDLFARKPELSAIYKNRLIAIALCQGAAEHFVKPGRGVNDFDLWLFFRSHTDRRFPYRRLSRIDFGVSRFGRNPDDSGYAGRRVDVIGRDISCGAGEEAAAAIHRYLATNKNKSPKLLAQRPVVLIYPEPELGRIAWDPLPDVRK